MAKVFISYRRADSEIEAGRLYDHLSREFGEEGIFKDVDSIEGGARFKERIRQSIEASDCLLVLIGDQWLDVRSKDGGRRLDKEDDYVRWELELARDLRKKIIPIRLNGITMPSPDELPKSIQFLPSLNALPLRPDPDFREDVKRVVNSIDGNHFRGKNIKKYAIVALIGFSVVGGAWQLLDTREKRLQPVPPVVQSDEANERLGQLERQIEKLTQLLEAPDLDAKSRKAILSVKSEIEEFIPQARANPSLLVGESLDVALVVAHHETKPGGSGIHGGKSYSEYNYNVEFAAKISEALSKVGVSVEVFYRDGSRNYRSGITAASVRGASIIIELHANSFSNSEIRGCEAMVREGDTVSSKISDGLLSAIKNSASIPIRRVRAIKKSGRGGASLFSTNVPTILLETFFLTNPDDLSAAINHMDTMASGIAESLSNSINDEELGLKKSSSGKGKGEGIDHQIAQKVVRIIAEQLGLAASGFSLDDHLIQKLGADSLDMVELVMALEEEFGIEITNDDYLIPEDRLKALTGSDLTKLVAAKLGKDG